MIMILKNYYLIVMLLIFIKHLIIDLTIKNVKALIIINEENLESSFDHILNILTQLVIRITGIHELVGNLIEYKMRPDGYCGKVRPNTTMADVQTYTQLLILGAVTGAREPELLSDFTHLVVENKYKEKAVRLMFKWQEQLRTLSNTIKEKNDKSRLQPFNAFNPSLLECSVSI